MQMTSLLIVACILVSCSILSPAPKRFVEFEEQQVAGPGRYQSPQWSPNSRFLAYIDNSLNAVLTIYDTETNSSWGVAQNVSNRHFSWKSDESLTYLKYRADLSGSPYPSIHDLRQVNILSKNDEIIISNLASPNDFAWSDDGMHLITLLTDPNKKAYFNDIYIIDVLSNERKILIEAESLGIDYIVMFTYSKDQTAILLYGIDESNETTKAEIIIFSLTDLTVLNRFAPGRIINPQHKSYPLPSIGDNSNSDWVGGGKWFLSSSHTASGDCYNYALFFFDTTSLLNSFCIPTESGIVTDPVIAPDLTKIAYITVVGPGRAYVMTASIPSELRERLQPKYE